MATHLRNEARVIYFPYCLRRQEDGSYVVLNRNYKPLGFDTGEYVDYKNYPIAVRFKGLTPKMAAKLSYDGSEGLDSIYLYNDGTVPTASAKNLTAYLNRLAQLAKLKLAA